MKKSIARIARTSAYSAMAVGILVATVVLVAIGKGYIFDFKNGAIQGGGLIFLSSHPGNATVYINGKKAKSSTPSKLNLGSGSYNIRLQKTGFRSWQKNLAVVASEVTWAQYPILIPDSLTTNNLANIGQLSLVVQSPDSKLAALGSPSKVQLFNLRDHKLSAVFKLNSAQSKGGYKVKSITWAADSEHVLLSLVNGKNTLHIVLSVLQPNQKINLNSLFDQPITNPQFSFQDWQQMYWLSPQGLRRLDLSAKTISAVIATKLNNFIVEPEALFAIQRTKSHLQLLRIQRDNKQQVLAKLPSSHYLLNYANYNDKAHLVLVDQTRHQLLLYSSSVYANQKAQVLGSVSATQAKLSPDQHFLTLQDGKNFSTYDFDLNQLYKFKLSGKQLGQVNWFDEFHLLVTQDSNINLLEYDGANQQALLDGAPLLPSISNPGQDSIISVSSGIKNRHIQISKIRQ